MDINPYEFKDNSLFEWANFCKQESVDVIIFIAAWNDHEPKRNDKASIFGIINYWLWRLTPLINGKKAKE